MGNNIPPNICLMLNLKIYVYCVSIAFQKEFVSLPDPRGDYFFCQQSQMVGSGRELLLHKQNTDSNTGILKIKGKPFPPVAQ